ncbi:targeting protein for Xklp2 homolog [Amphibalanus amphitrite]|uniref:targeting protein for Xklp2 homolog n=1 Tax=Amphibalanus amphitrite TaxID=1232801 RepID=UPI001C904589|nr:targeting protein for Xklp2 homolog [Amphibalanus amphitrite]
MASQNTKREAAPTKQEAAPSQELVQRSCAPALKENIRSVPKNLVMGVQTLVGSGAGQTRPAGLRDVTNSPGPRTRAPLKRAATVDSQDEPTVEEPCAKQSRPQSEPRSPPATEHRAVPEGKDSTPTVRPGSRLPSSRGRGRSVDTAPTRASPRLARGAAPPPLVPPRRPTPVAAGRRRTPASSPAPATSRRTPATGQPAATRRTPSTGAAASRRAPCSTSRRRSLSQNDAARMAAGGGPPNLVVAETPNVLRRGLQLRSAARAAAEKAVKDEQQSRLDSLRRQMADYKKKAAEAKQPVRPRVAAVKPPTRPQPFHLHDDRSATGSVGGRPVTEFRSTAQLIEGFQRRTPPRFHSRPAGDRPSGSVDAAPSHVTIGRTPPLMTRARSRSTNNIPSREQQELAELEEARQHQVRARPVNRRVLEQKVGVPAKQARPTTAVEPFHLTQPAPRTQSAADETTGSAVSEFRAQPAPRAILSAPQGVPARQAAPATKPQSPALQLKQRMAERRKEVQVNKEKEQQQSGGVVRANPIPDAGVPFRPNVEHRTTRPAPFSFEERDKQRQAEKERKIQEVLEEERRQREFRAQLLPPSSPRGVPQRRTPTTTRPEPFQLPGDQQAAAAAARRQKKLEEEAAAARAAAEFHAQPCTVTRRDPYQPQRSARGPTAPRTPLLHTDQRSARRQSFEERQKQREAELLAAQQEAERQRQREEEEEVARQRREAVHHAQPIRRYRPVHVQPSDAPLTAPRTPNWARNSSRASSYRDQ